MLTIGGLEYEVDSVGSTAFVPDKPESGKKPEPVSSGHFRGVDGVDPGGYDVCDSSFDTDVVAQ